MNSAIRVQILDETVRISFCSSVRGNPFLLAAIGKWLGRLCLFSFGMETDVGERKFKLVVLYLKTSYLSYLHRGQVNTKIKERFAGQGTHHQKEEASILMLWQPVKKKGLIWFGLFV